MKPHIFWILPDAMRNKKGGGINKRAEVCYEFDKESIRFKNAITSATSTLMSVSSIFSGRFSAELYPDFKYVNDKKIVTKTYPDYMGILKKNDYLFNSVIAYDGAGRLLFEDLLGVYNTKGSETRDIDNIYALFIKMMQEKFDPAKPNFVLMYIPKSMKRGPDYTKKIMDYLKKQSYYPDSIIVLSSDHGHIDYGKNTYLGWMKYPRNHSNYITESTYYANCNIKLPARLSHVKKKVIETPICLIDIFETVLDYLDIKTDFKDKKAISLKKIIEEDNKIVRKRLEKRIIRVDTKYHFQNDRKTRLISSDGNYLIQNENDLEFIPKHFKEFYIENEKESLRNCLNLIESRYNVSFLQKVKDKKIAIYNFDYVGFIDIIYKKLNQKNTVSILDLKNLKKNYKHYDLILAIVNNNYFYNYTSLYSFCKKNKITLVFVDSLLHEIEFKKYHYFKDTLRRVKAKSKAHLIVKIGYFFFLLFTQYYEASLFNEKRNYHKVIINL